jgi:predicted NAD/FAD-binding protein
LNNKRIAVIGSGIAGLVSAHLLSRQHEVSLFEANDYLGGHTHTVDINHGGVNHPIDTGFIVFNKKTYPNFCRLLNQLNIPIQKSEMSFSYRSERLGFEYNGHDLNTLFSDRRNLFRPSFYRFIGDIIRFNRVAKQFLQEAPEQETTLGTFLKRNQYSEKFIRGYLVPMTAAIWSKKPDDVMKTSAYFILQFMNNHGLLNIVDRPDWYVLTGGSRAYINYLTPALGERIYLNAPVQRIQRNQDGVILTTPNGTANFDAVVIATHSDQALAMLDQPSQDEEAILGNISYVANDVVLHTDPVVMPKNALSWASWNYLDNENALPTLTYYMNRLQSLETKQPFFVSMNLTDTINPDKIIQRFHYSHPCFDVPAVIAQRRHQIINGYQNTYYAGAYWGYGFHEDGVNSALAACKPLGVEL